MIACPNCTGRTDNFHCRNCSYGAQIAQLAEEDWSDAQDLNDGFTLPEQIDADHPLTIGE